MIRNEIVDRSRNTVNTYERNSPDARGVSVIVAGGRLQYIENVFDSYLRQNISKKEIIVVLNTCLSDFDQWLEHSKYYPMTRVYQVDEDRPLGDCINYGVDHSVFENVALFSDSDYYGPAYLSSALQVLEQKNASLIGKNNYIQISRTAQIQEIRSLGKENSFTDFVIFPTFVFKKALLNLVRFPYSDTELDIQFCQECLKRNLRIYASDRYNYSFVCDS